MSKQEFTKGDKVTWQSHGSRAEGTAEEKITSDTTAAKRTVRASEDDPQYLVIMRGRCRRTVGGTAKTGRLLVAARC
jgi:hypothetical protein